MVAGIGTLITTCQGDVQFARQRLVIDTIQSVPEMDSASPGVRSKTLDSVTIKTLELSPVPSGSGHLQATCHILAHSRPWVSDRCTS